MVAVAALMSMAATVPAAKVPKKTNPTATVVFTEVDQEATVLRFVANITNPASQARTGMSVQWIAKDATGVLVGSYSSTLPAIPAKSTFAYVGGAGSANLTGTPSSVTVQITRKGTLTKHPTPMFAVAVPEFALQRVIFAPPPKYDVHANVTTGSKSVKRSQITVTAILKDATGKIVGAGFAFLTNLPELVPSSTTFKAEVPGIRVPDGTPASVEVAGYALP